MSKIEARKTNKAIYFAKKTLEIECKLCDTPDQVKTLLKISMSAVLARQFAQTPAEIFSSDSASIDAKRARKRRAKRVETESSCHPLLRGGENEQKSRS